MDRTKCGPIGLAILDAGKTVPQVAKDLGLNIKTVYSWAYGRTEPSGSDMIRLAKYLGVKPEALAKAS